MATRIRPGPVSAGRNRPVETAARYGADPRFPRGGNFVLAWPGPGTGAFPESAVSAPQTFNLAPRRLLPFTTADNFAHNDRPAVVRSLAAAAGTVATSRT